MSWKKVEDEKIKLMIIHHLDKNPTTGIKIILYT